MAPRIPSTMHPATISVPAPSGKNKLLSRISVGNRPLQGTMALVRMARSRSRGESMIRHPVTPTALQPRPIHRVSACLPQPPHRRIPPSSKKAILGRYPTSSKIVNSGKKIAIGGSITAITRAQVA